MDLSLILQRCKAGEEAAWEALVRRYQARVYGIAFHYLGNTEDARDLAQEVFVRIYRNLEMCEPDGFVPWLAKITRNACIDHLRRKKARTTGFQIALDEVAELPSSAPGPERELEAKAKKQLVHRALQSLTFLNREIILLKEIQGLKIGQIARLLQVPLGTVKSRSNRAKIELARRIAAMRADGEKTSEGLS